MSYKILSNSLVGRNFLSDATCDMLSSNFKNNGEDAYKLTKST